jgi:hypothetical protein
VAIEFRLLLLEFREVFAIDPGAGNDEADLRSVQVDEDPPRSELCEHCFGVHSNPASMRSVGKS